MLAAFHPVILTGFDRLQIGRGDPRLVHYIIEHSWLWLTQQPHHEDFWSPPVFYPEPNVGAFSDTMVGSAPFYWIWRAVGLPASASFQLWMMTCLSLNFLIAYLFLMRLELGPWPSAVGAFLFGFGINRVANFNSPQLFPLFYSMLSFYAALRALEPPRPGETTRRSLWVFVFFGGLVGQAWSAYYPAFFAIFLLGLAGLISLFISRARSLLLGLLRSHPLSCGLALVLSVAAIWPMASAHLAATELVGWRSYGAVFRGLPTWQSWVFTGKNSWLYSSLSDLDLFTFRSGVNQHTNGIGFLTTALCLAGLLLERKRTIVQIVLATSLVAMLLSTRFLGDHTLWRPIYDLVPGARAIRFVARMGFFLPLPAGIGLACFLRRGSRGVHRWIVILLALACIAEQLHRLPGSSEARYRSEVARIAAGVDPDCEAFFLITHAAGVPGDSRFSRRHRRVIQIMAMWAGIEAGKPTINGFYGKGPRRWRLSDIDVADEREALALERRLDHWIQAKGLKADRVDRVNVLAESLTPHVRTGID